MSVYMTYPSNLKFFINLIILSFTMTNWLQKALYWYDNLELFKNLLI